VRASRRIIFNGHAEDPAQELYNDSSPEVQLCQNAIERKVASMHATDLTLPERAVKPRDHGLTVVIDNGAPRHYFEDVIESASDLIDLVKFGWGTSLVTSATEQKIECLRAHGIGYFFGGTLFEKYVSQRRLDSYLALCQRYQCEYVEVSNGTIVLPNREKARIVSEISSDFHVLSEVGYKDSERSLHLHPAQWIACMREDLEAGAERVITEARESGTSGICRSDGELRYGLIEEMLASGLDTERIVFEAPTKAMQTYFIKQVGANVNVANVALSDVISLETLRLGLRSDTFMLFD